MQPGLGSILRLGGPFAPLQKCDFSQDHLETSCSQGFLFDRRSPLRLSCEDFLALLPSLHRLLGVCSLLALVGVGVSLLKLEMLFDAGTRGKTNNCSIDSSRD